ncbi:hypothetical protein [Pseudonocardia sp. HH130630-07]|uniref:hypothetical protein n=1 Tax=Pseudonocardia sp. HH130630-07 TaxID=1690815 RepID=UPI0018D3050D|nr:hypothetical protein [Pseudonocardia sp. HH130630-07]
MVPTGSPRTGSACPPMIGWDVGLSVTALLVTGALVVVGVVGAVLAFLDYCPPPDCSSVRLRVAVAGSLAVAVAAGIAGLAMTVLRIVARRISWPFALATLVVTTTAIAVGISGYAGAMGY